MAQTIGQTLQKKRQQRGLSVADVSHDTRIHADTIRGLEADDYSVFASTTYARSFLLLYSRHLEVDADEALNEFASVAQQLSKSGRVTLAPAVSSIEPGESIQAHKISKHRPSYGGPKQTAAPLFLAVAVLLLLLIIPTFYFIGKKANSLEEAASILNGSMPSSEEKPDSKGEQKETKPAPTPKPAPSLIDQEFSQHRFPRPLSEAKPDTLPRAVPSNSNRPLKAIPITPPNPAPSKPGKKQNRN